MVLALAGCKLDNYDQPNASLYGTVYDQTDNTPIQQDLNSSQGSNIDIVELGFETTQTRILNFKTDGSYCEKNMFNGRYSISTKRANFYPITDEIDVKGDTEYNIYTTPYIKLLDTDIQFLETDGLVVATFRLKTDEKVKTVRLFCDPNPNVGLGMNTAGDNSCLINVGQTVDEATTITLKMSTLYMDDGNDFYFRVGALADVSEAKYNYAPAVKLHIDNSNYVEPEVEEVGVQIDACEDATGWGSSLGKVTTDTDCREGSSSISVSGTSTTVWFQKKFSEPINTKVTKASGHLKFWLYVSDADRVPATGGGQIELTSSGGPDVNEFHWGFNQVSLSSGWNEIDLALADASVSGGNADLSAINYVRIYHTGVTAGDAITFKLDDIRIYAPDTIDECDSADGWGSGVGTVSVDAVDKRDGEGSISVTGKSSGTVFFKKKFDEPFAAPVTKEKGHLTLYFYVSDASALPATNAGQIEITSSGGPDVNEINWTFDKFSLSTGWNALDLALASGSDNGCNLDAINYVRIYHAGSTGAEVTLKLDKIAFYEAD